MSDLTSLPESDDGPPPSSAKPLSGLRVLDLSRVLAGPMCTMLLGDLGAEVLKVEGPEGDETRAWGPPFLDGQSAYFLSVNRNKHAVVLDLRTTDGRETFRRLVTEVDVLVDNFRPGRLAAWGFGRDVLQSVNPRLIHCSITGFGDEGPYRDFPGFDPVIEAMSGFMSLNGPSDRFEPYKAGVAVVDVLSALYASSVVCGLLRQRELTGKGAYVSVPLFDVAIASLVNVASSYLVSGREPERYGNDHPNIAPFGSFEASDGPLMICVGNDRQWATFCRLLSIDVRSHPAYLTNEGRVSDREGLRRLVEVSLGSDTAAAWAERLMDGGVPAGAVVTVGETLSDPWVRASGLVRTAHDGEGTDFDAVAPPFQIDGERPAMRLAPPRLGSGDALLRRWLAASDTEGPSVDAVGRSQ